MPPIPYSALGGVGQIGVGDFNHDGKLDLVVVGGKTVGSTTTGYITVLLGAGTGNFTSPLGSPMVTPFVGGYVTVADFNKDGNLDLAVAGNDQVNILLGDGTGNFHSGSQGPLPVGQVVLAIVQGDFNGDGNIDLAVANWFFNTFTILLGDGEGSFSSFYEGCNGTPTSLGVADIDGDGVQDIVIGIDNPSGELSVLLGGAGIFPLPGSTFEVPGGPQGLVLADFNGDGRIDVATANFDGTVSVFLGASATSSVELTLSGAASPSPTVGVAVNLSSSVTSTGWDQAIGNVNLVDGTNVVTTGILNQGTTALTTAFTTVGVHMLVASYRGDFRTLGSTSAPLTLTVSKGSQTITFPALPNHSYGDPPFQVPVSASSGLPVTLTVLSGPATISGNVLTLTGTGVVTIQASQSGNAN